MYRNPNKLVTFYIGKEPNVTEFKLHKDVVCERSSVLKADFDSGFVEGQTQTYRVEDTSKEAFTYLAQCFYSSVKIINFELHGGDAKDDPEITDEELDEHYKLCMVQDRKVAEL